MNQNLPNLTKNNRGSLVGLGWFCQGSYRYKIRFPASTSPPDSYFAASQAVAALATACSTVFSPNIAA